MFRQGHDEQGGIVETWTSRAQENIKVSQVFQGTGFWLSHNYQRQLMTRQTSGRGLSSGGRKSGADCQQ